MISGKCPRQAEAARAPVLAALTAGGFPGAVAVPIPATLEDVFLRLVGRGREAA